MNKAKSIILSISIAIVLTLFVTISIETFYPTPKYDDFCGDEIRLPLKQNETEQSCLEKGGKWLEVSETCDYTYYCRQDLDQSRESHGKTIFIISVIIGLIALLTGWLVLKKQAVSTGIMGGGSILIVYGIIRYWEFAQDYLRITILGIVLAVLIYIGYKKLN